MKTTDSSLCSSFFPCSRMYRNYVLWQIWASMPKRTVSKQRKSSNPFKIQTLSNFHQMRWLDKFLVLAKTGYRQQLGLSFQEFQTPPQKFGTENCCLTLSTRNVCKNVSSRPTGLFSRFCRNDSPLFTTATQLFFQSLFSHTLCSRLERFSTANNLSNLWCSKLQHVSTYAFCR